MLPMAIEGSETQNDGMKILGFTIRKITVAFVLGALLGVIATSLFLSTPSVTEEIISSESAFVIDLTPPLNKKQLGGASWSLFHSIGALYPDEPTQEEQQAASDFFSALGHIYPCKVCRAHFAQFLEKNPPPVESHASLSAWLCLAHNRVNKALDKPLMECENIDEIWGRELNDCGCDEAGDVEDLDAALAQRELDGPDTNIVADMTP